MKHVFITHSNITKVIIEAIIKDLNLSQEEVLIISFRKNFIEGYNNIDLEDFREKKKHLLVNKGRHSIHKIPKIYKVIWEMDELLAIKSDFIFYTPQVFNAFFQVIATHKYCNQVNIIEEGSAAYVRDEETKDFSFKVRVYNQLLYKNRIKYPRTFYRTEMFSKKKSSVYYIVNDKAFPWFSNRVLVEVSTTEKKHIPDGSSVFLPDGLVEFNRATEEEYLRVVKRFVEDNKSESVVFVKFHPQQSQIIKKMIKDEFEKHFEISVVDSDVIMEKEFLIKRENKLQIFGCVSSLLFYSQMAEQNTFSYIKELNIESNTPFAKDQLLSLKNLYTEIGVKLI